MTTFSYTTGNPSNLTAGATASMNDIQGPFTDLRTFVNGANIDTTNLATSAKPVTLLGAYETIAESPWVTATSAFTLGGYIPSQTGALVANGTASASTLSPIGLVQADHAVSGLTAKLRLRAEAFVNTVAPAITFTFGLHVVTSVAGGSGQTSITYNGTAVSGSTAAMASPTQGGAYAQGSDFDIPSGTSGSLWVLAVALSGTPAANSATSFRVLLQRHYV